MLKKVLYLSCQTENKQPKTNDMRIEEAIDKVAKGHFVTLPNMGRRHITSIMQTSQLIKVTFFGDCTRKFRAGAKLPFQS